MFRTYSVCNQNIQDQWRGREDRADKATVPTSPRNRSTEKAPLPLFPRPTMRRTSPSSHCSQYFGVLEPTPGRKSTWSLLSVTQRDLGLLTEHHANQHVAHNQSSLDQNHSYATQRHCVHSHGPKAARDSTVPRFSCLFKALCVAETAGS